MKCPYCGVKFNFWVNSHPKCEQKKSKYQFFILNYISDNFLAGTFKINNLPQDFLDAENFLTSADMTAAIQVGFDNAVNKMIEDNEIDQREIGLWEKYSDEWHKAMPNGISNVLTPEGCRKIMYGHILNVLRTEGLEAARKLGYQFMKPNSEIMLSKNEEFIFRSEKPWRASILSIKTKYKGHSTGASYQLTKNTRIRHSQHRGRPVQYEEWQSVGYGEIAITNKYFYFLGSANHKDLKERLSSVSSVETLDAGIILNTNLKTRPAIMLTASDDSDPWMASNILTLAQSL